MTPEQMRELQKELGLTNQGMADLLGCSKVSYARFPVGSRPIPPYIARLCIAIKVLHHNGLLRRYLREAKLY